MLSSSAARLVPSLAKPSLSARSVLPVASTLDSQKRSVINLAALKKRINATANVAKLTGVMKLVASSKLKAVEDQLAIGRPFGESLKSAVMMPTEEAEKSADEQGAKKIMCVVQTTDRGLCGGVNSSVTRFAKEKFKNLEAAGHEVSVMALGDKARVQIGREMPHLMKASVDQCFDKDPMFPLAAAIAENIVRQEYDTLCFMYNEFENTAKFNTVSCYMPTMAGFAVGVLPPKLSGYSVEPENNEETLINLQEYATAGVMYSIMLESQASEVSQRIIAMENASTNAGDMVDRFTLTYNRGRQAKITTELTEIVAGSEALVDDSAED
jgi:F-type H+-transporting ATPase subunit gamma